MYIQILLIILNILTNHNIHYAFLYSQLSIPVTYPAREIWQAQKKGKRMFYKTKFEIINSNFNMHTTKINEIIKAVQQEKDNNQTALKLIEGQDKLLQKLIPTINRHNNQIKKLEESYQLLVMVCEKIVSKIDPEWNKKNESVKKTKATSEKVRKSNSK